MRVWLSTSAERSESSSSMPVGSGGGSLLLGRESAHSLSSSIGRLRRLATSTPTAAATVRITSAAAAEQRHRSVVALLALGVRFLDADDERRVGRRGADRDRGDEVAADVALGEVALPSPVRTMRSGTRRPGADQQLPVDRVERERVVGVEDRLQLLVVVDVEVRQPVGDDRRLPLELEQLAALLGVVDRHRRRHEEGDHGEGGGEQHRRAGRAASCASDAPVRGGSRHRGSW